VHFIHSAAAFDSFFFLYSIYHSGICAVIHQFATIVFGRKRIGINVVKVLLYALIKIAGNAGVQRSVVCIGEDIHPALLFHAIWFW
jgi:hypothetical protein